MRTTVFASFFIIVLLFTGTTVFNLNSNKTVELRFMTYNIRAAVESDLNQIAYEIRSHNPDVVALQEVDVNWSERSDYKNQISYLGKRLGMNFFFGEIYSIPPDSGRNEIRMYGLGLLSTFPIEYRENHTLTRLSSLDDNAQPVRMSGFPEIAITQDGRTIHIFNAHLDYRPDPIIREKQVGEMLEIINKKEGPVVLMGDLNAEPEDSELSNLFELFGDAWEKGDGKGFTYPAEEPQKRIDYILYSDHFQVDSTYVGNSQKSDHRPVIGTLLLE